MSASWLKLTGVVQSYDWGKLGPQSLVAKLANRSHESGRFAELWFGDHPRGPSRIVGSPEIDLRHEISRNSKKWLGNRFVPSHQAGSSLPFLFKVLSIDSSAGLSLQIHPKKNDVDYLRSHRPELLSDSGVKIEMGIARTQVKLFIGIKPLDQLERVLRENSAYRKAVSLEGREIGPTTIAEISSALLSLDDAAGARLVNEIADGLSTSESKDFPACFERLRAHYGDSDPGLRLLPLLNLVTLDRGQGIFIPPGTIHAYLEGDLVECMVSSDNVLRAGLTRKDVQRSVVAECTTWQPYEPTNARTECSPFGNFLHRYVGDIGEAGFVVDACEDTSGRLAIKGKGAPTLLVVVGGSVHVTSKDSGSDEILPGEGILLAAIHDDVNFDFRDATAYLVTSGL